MSTCSTSCIVQLSPFIWFGFCNHLTFKVLTLSQFIMKLMWNCKEKQYISIWGTYPMIKSIGQASVCCQYCYCTLWEVLRKQVVRFEVLTALKKNSTVLCNGTPCGLIERYQRFGGTWRQISRNKICHALKSFFFKVWRRKFGDRD
jgi:hypothetical protein